MHSRHHLVLASLFAFTPLALAQDEPPTPAPELSKFSPLIGDWSGSGTAIMDASQDPIEWVGESSYQWCLDKFFVQEDTYIKFATLPEPMVFRTYYGWDGENKRYVSVMIGNDGVVSLDEIRFRSNDAIVKLVTRKTSGRWLVERATTQIVGDSMQINVDFLMEEGKSMEVVRGALSKSEKIKILPMEATDAMVKPNEPMAKLARMAGVYSVKGQMIFAPGVPAMTITGTDTATPLFKGTVLHVQTLGIAEGMPEEYRAHAFMSWDATRQRYLTVFVSNMGECGSMESWFAADGKSLIATSNALIAGQPTAQRFVSYFDDDGVLQRVVGHSLVGAHLPLETFAATYTKK